MAQHIKGVGIVASYNKEKAKVVIPPPPSPAITGKLDRFDIGTKTWSSRKAMNESRAGFALFADADFLFAIGGTDGARIHKSIEEYDIYTNTWAFKAEMPHSRCFFASCEDDGYIYCIGGFTANALGVTSAINKFDRYDTLTNTWHAMADLPVGYSVMLGVAHAVNDKIYVLSGYKNNFTTYLDRVLTYDIIADSWAIGPTLTPLELTLFRRTLPFSFVKGGYIYVVNGLYYEVPEPIKDADGKVIATPDPIIQYLPDVYKYEITTGLIERGERDFNDLPRARYSGGSASVGETHYFIGGINQNSNTLRLFESVSSTTLPFTYTDYARLLRGRSSLGITTYGGDYGNALFVAGGVLSKQGENFLRVEVDAFPIQVRLDGKQSANVIITLADENLESPADVLIRLTATGGQDDLVIFTADEIHVKNGYALATLDPRSDDAFGTVEMSNDANRAYSVTISGAVIDSKYYGDTDPLPQTPIDDSGSVTDGAVNHFSKIILPNLFKPVLEFDTVISADQTTNGSFFATGLDSLGGFLDLRPAINGGGKNTSVKYFSDIAWLPQVVSVIDTNVGNFVDARAALDRISRELPFGGSPIFDGIERSGEALEFDITGVKKSIYLLTDGQENCSHYTPQQSLDKINLLQGVGNTPIISSQFRVIPQGLFLDQGIRKGSTDLEFLAAQTNASSIYVSTNEEISESIQSILRAKGFIGSGVFTCEIDLGDQVIIESIKANFKIPDAETDAYWHYSVGNDDRKFSLLTDRINASQTVNLVDTFGRYVRFVAEFTATLDSSEYNAHKIIPPALTSIEIVYHQKTESYIYLNPHVTEADPMQIVVTLDATRPQGSDILLGAHDSMTGTWEDYNPPSSPAVENSTRIVLPIRKSLDTTTYTLEHLLPIDGFVFETTYGRWSEGAEVSIYKDGTLLVADTDYKLLPHKGRVVFSYKTTAAYVISIENKPNLSIAAKIVNRVHGRPIVISGAGYMYSTLKPKILSAGNLIVPDATNLLLTPLQPDRNSVFRANYTYSDLKGRDEKPANKGGTLITWYVNDQEQIDIRNLNEWDNKAYRLITSGDVIYFTVEPGTDNSGGILLGRKVRSLPVTVA